MDKSRKKAVLKVIRIIGITIGIILLFLLGTFIYHRIMLSKEKELLTPLGQLVDVDGAKMCVYSEGDGDKTLVFMSGSGTCSPILDFRTLYSRLSDEYRIAVIERFGYGFSDVTDKSRDIDTLVENDRAALTGAGIEAPYILCPHSMAGLEAIYWAEKYPDEVSGMIGLDMALPKVIDEPEMQVKEPVYKAVGLAAKTGVTRYGNICGSSAAFSGTLTDEEKDIYRAVFYSRTMTSDMINEAVYLRENAEKTRNVKLSQTPLLLFCSSGEGLCANWKSIQEEFAEENGGEIIYLECGHYVHDFEYEKISAEIKKYINGE